MSHETPVQPKIADLLARYLAKQAEAQAVGAAGCPGEVTPYEAGPVQPIDPKLAWDETLAVLTWYGVAAPAKPWKAPPQWSGLVAGHEPVVALAMGVGNFPQMVRDFQKVVHATDLTALQPQPSRPAPAPELTAWADELAGRYPQTLLALGALRLAKQFDAAEALVRTHDAAVPAELRGAWENEKAVLAWHAGRAEEARALWQRLEPSVPVLFNRGLADLFLNRRTAARASLSAAVARIPDDSAWHHLGRLYLALAQLKG